MHDNLNKDDSTCVHCRQSNASNVELKNLLSHELRSSISRIRGLIGMLVDVERETVEIQDIVKSLKHTAEDLDKSIVSFYEKNVRD